jgi:hypothetical protein
LCPQRVALAVAGGCGSNCSEKVAQRAFAPHLLLFATRCSLGPTTLPPGSQVGLVSVLPSQYVVLYVCPLQFLVEMRINAIIYQYFNELDVNRLYVLVILMVSHETNMPLPRNRTQSPLPLLLTGPRFERVYAGKVNVCLLG